MTNTGQLNLFDPTTTIAEAIDLTPPLLDEGAHSGFAVGDRVECDAAFIGQVGTVQRIGTHCAVSVVWVDYGGGKPLYPCALEHLSHA